MSESDTKWPEDRNPDCAKEASGSFVSSLRRPWVMALLLVGATLLAYLPAIRGQFLWDDDSWTSKIGGLLENISGLWRMWSNSAALQQYYPLAGSTFWIDYQLWGFHAVPYHVENVLLHALGALLFWKLLRELQVPGAVRSPPNPIPCGSECFRRGWNCTNPARLFEIRH
jgi:hypothetical protein